MIRHANRINRQQYSHPYRHVSAYGFLAILMILAVGYGNSGSKSAVGRGGAITIHTEETKSLKQLQIERSLERHRVGR